MNLNILTQFKMWTTWHYVYILAPIVITLILYFALRKTKFVVRYIVGVIIGIASLLVLIVRNVDIYRCNGFDPEIIPLQVCHFGNIMVFIALVFRSKTAGSVAWSLNVLAAFSSHIFADSLEHYSNIFCIRAQAYIWGHLLIVVGGLYAVLLKIVRLDWKSYGYGILTLVCLLIPSIILNSYFRDVCYRSINYFYIYNSEGAPFEFLYGLVERSHYGWFTIDWVYTILMVVIFTSLMTLMFMTQFLLYIKKDKDYETENVFLDLYHRHQLKKQNN